MFECTLQQGVLFKKIILALSDVVEQGNFNIDEEDGICFQGMDSSHVSLVALRLAREGFEEFRCDQAVSIGIQFLSLNKILKCMSSKDSLQISVHDNNPDLANFVFSSEKGDHVSNFSLKLVDIDAEQLGIPETEYKAVVCLPSIEFQRICRDLSAIGDTVTIAASKEGVKFGVNGDIGKGEMSLKATNEGMVDDDEDEDIIVRVIEPVTQQFSIKFLTNFTKATSLAQNVKISMGPDVPLEVSYEVGKIGHLRYYLAPKIDDDE
eukprot:327722_1